MGNTSDQVLTYQGNLDRIQEAKIGGSRKKNESERDDEIN